METAIGGIEGSSTNQVNNLEATTNFLAGERGDSIVNTDSTAKADPEDISGSEAINDSVVQNKVEPTQNKEDVISSKDGTDATEEEWMDILGNGQLKKKVIRPGEPDSRPTKPNICIIRFVGKLDSGKVVDQEESLEINLGDNETIQGLDFALALMDKGERAEVFIASRFAYGTLGRKPHIPPNSNILYDVTLLDTKPEPLVSSLGIEERIAIGCRKKERGNWWYAREEHSLAIHCYRRALEYLDDTDIPVDCDMNQVGNLLEERLKTYNNLGASQMKICAYDAALLSVGQVISSQPRNVKALFRKARILKAKGEFEESIQVAREALTIEPENKGIQVELSRLLAAQRKDNTKQRNLYKKMMGSNSQDEVDKKKRGTTSSTLKWIAIVSFAVAVLGAVAVKYKL